MAYLSLDVFMRPDMENNDVIRTIIRAMKHRTSRVKAVEFLELLAKQGGTGEVLACTLTFMITVG